MVGSAEMRHTYATMKFSAVTLALILALPFAAQAQIKETKTWVNGRPVVVRTETSTQTPVACQAAFDQTLEQQGWHDQIYCSVNNDKAMMIVSQRDADACCVKEVKVTFWRSALVEGKTVTQSWVYTLKAGEVNRFLDNELPQIAAQFNAAPMTQKTLKNS